MTTSPSAADERARILSILGAVFSGVLMSLQSRMNGQLSRELGWPLQAALWSFGSGLVVLCVLSLLPAQRRGLAQTWFALRTRQLGWWVTLAGMLGGLLVMVQAAVVPSIGVALFAIAIVAGQTCGGLATDALGVGPGGRRPITMLRLVSCVLALAGVTLAATATSGGSLGWGVALAVLAGLGTSLQSAWNGRTTALTGVPLATTAVNFASGSLAIGAAVLVESIASGRRFVPLHGSWWIWWGGILGLTYVAIIAVAVRHIGVLTFTLVALVTQLAAALVLDLFTPGVGFPTPMRLTGIALTGVAAVMAGLGSRPRS